MDSLCLGFLYLVKVLGALKEGMGKVFQTKEALKTVFGMYLLGCFHKFSLDPYYEP